MKIFVAGWLAGLILPLLGGMTAVWAADAAVAVDIPEALYGEYELLAYPDRKTGQYQPREKFEAELRRAYTGHDTISIESALQSIPETLSIEAKQIRHLVPMMPPCDHPSFREAQPKDLWGEGVIEGLKAHPDLGGLDFSRYRAYLITCRINGQDAVAPLIWLPSGHVMSGDSRGPAMIYHKRRTP